MSLPSVRINVRSTMRITMFGKRALRTCMLAAGAAMLSLALPAQTVQTPPGATGTLHGSVQDPDAAIIPGAAITLTPPSGAPVTGKSGSDGSYRIAAPANTYTITVSMPGFATFSKAGVKIVAGQSIALDAKLIVGEQTQVVNVNVDAATVSVDPDSNSSSLIIKGDDLKALSDDPDELSAELTALAGPAAGPSGGQIYVDGFTGGQLPPKSSIREIRINQNPFSAEYDKLGFGRIEVFTKPGTDRLHGSLSFQGNDNVLNTSNPFLGAANSQPPYHTFFILGNVTGPLTKNMSYSIGGSRRTIQTNVIVDPTGFYSTSPTDTTPCAPGTVGTCGNFGYPASARAVFQPQLREDITPRLDIAIGPKNVLTLRYQYEGGNTQNSGAGGNALPSTFANISNTENTIQVVDTQTFNPKVVNETRFEYQRATANSSALSTAPSINVQGSFVSGGSGTQTLNTISSHIELQNYSSIALTHHFIRFGGRLRTTGESSTNIGNPNGLFTYNFLLDPCSDPTASSSSQAGCVTTTGATPCLAANVAVSSYQCGIASQFDLTTTLRPTIQARETDVGLYAEDDWKIKPNLTFSYGLRYETENIVSKHDLAPRFSAAYGIPRAGGKPPTTVLRAGFGIFYDRFALSDLLINQQLLAGNPAQQQLVVTNPNIMFPLCQPGVTNPGAACGAASSGLTTAYSLAPNLRSAYTMQGAIGLDQQLGKLGTISVNYLPNRGDHEFLTRVTPTGTQILKQYQSTGIFNQSQFFVNANIRTRRVTAFGYYALNIANSNTSGSTFNPTSTNPATDYGRAAFANRNQMVAGASYSAPYKISLSPFLIARSGTPYNITTGKDNNGDSIYNDRPGFMPGQAINCASAASFNPSNVGGEIPINDCTGPAIFTFNLRAARVFGFGPRIDNAGNPAGQGGGRGGAGGGGRGGGGGGGRGAAAGGPMGGGLFGPGGGGGGTGTGRRYNLTLGAQAQNLFNAVPYAAPTATSALTSTEFGKLTQLAGRPFSTPNAIRLVQLQATFNF